VVNFIAFDVCKMQLSWLNFEKESFFEHGEVKWKQRGQLERTTFSRVRANSPAHGSR
jgi:hypothetical protein